MRIENYSSLENARVKLHPGVFSSLHDFCLLLKYFLGFVLFLLLGDLECSPRLICMTLPHIHVLYGESPLSSFLIEVLTVPVVVAVCQTWSVDDPGKISVGAQYTNRQVHYSALK